MFFLWFGIIQMTLAHISSTKPIQEWYMMLHDCVVWKNNELYIEFLIFTSRSTPTHHHHDICENVTVFIDKFSDCLRCHSQLFEKARTRWLLILDFIFCNNVFAFRISRLSFIESYVRKKKRVEKYKKKLISVVKGETHKKAFLASGNARKIRNC